MSQENLKTMIMQNFGGGKRGVLLDCANSELIIIFLSNKYPLLSLLEYSIIKIYCGTVKSTK